MEITLARRDWGGLLNGTVRDQSNTAVLEKIGELRWQGETHLGDIELLTINLTNQEQAALFYGLNGFAKGGYSNTLETYEQVARVYTAFNLLPPKAQLPHGDGIARAYVTYAFGFPVAAPTDFAAATK
jgi:hypothetical protein